MKISRLFEIIYILLNKKTITAKELSSHFEVSQRTIYRDIETLSEAGIPIYTNKGKGGGISLLDNFVLNKSLISKDEQNEILSALQGLNAINYSNIDNVLSKLTSLFGINNTNWIEVDFSDWSEKDKDRFNIIKTAVTTKMIVNFDYFNSYGGKSNRTIEPLKLRFKDKAWYLIGFCRLKEDTRIFKINRIKNIKIIEESFNRELIQDKENNQSNYKLEKVKLKINESQAYRLYDEFDEDSIIKNEDGSFIVTESYPQGEWIYGYILSFGFNVEVLEPLHIREGIKERLKKALNIYL